MDDAFCLPGVPPKRENFQPRQKRGAKRHGNPETAVPPSGLNYGLPETMNRFQLPIKEKLEAQ
jgi:hypothetical protein